MQILLLNPELHRLHLVKQRLNYYFSEAIKLLWSQFKVEQVLFKAVGGVSLKRASETDLKILNIISFIDLSSARS